MNTRRDINIARDPHTGGYRLYVQVYRNDPRPEWHYIGTFGTYAAARERATHINR